MDKEKLGKIIIENQESFYRIAKTILKNDDDCKDAISQMIIKAFEKRHTLRKEEYAKTWLTRILINECHANFRFYNKNKNIDEYDEAIAYEKDDYSYLYEAISKLPYNYRICINLYYIEGFSIKEIAQMLDSTESAIKKRLVRARGSLKLDLEGGAV